MFEFIVYTTLQKAKKPKRNLVYLKILFKCFYHNKKILLIKSIRYFTIHALGSLEMLEAAQKSAAGTNLEFLAVSILTSWNKNRTRTL